MKRHRKNTPRSTNPDQLLLYTGKKLIHGEKALGREWARQFSIEWASIQKSAQRTPFPVITRSDLTKLLALNFMGRRPGKPFKQKEISNFVSYLISEGFFAEVYPNDQNHS